MKRLIYFILLVPVLTFSQAQSYDTPETPHTCVFREVFNSEYEVVRNGGTVTDVTFSKGKSVFDGTNDHRIEFVIEEEDIQNITIRARVKPSGDGVIISQGAGFYRIRISGSEYLISVSGRAGSSVSTGVNAIIGEWQDIVLTTKSGDTDFYLNGEKTDISSASGTFVSNSIDWAFGARYSGSWALEWTGEIDYVDIWDSFMTEAEVSNLYNNRRFTALNIPAIFSLSAERGMIEETYGTSFTNTNVEVFKDGFPYVMYYDGTTSQIVFANTVADITTENLTVSAWVKAEEGASKRIVSKGSWGAESYILAVSATTNPFIEVEDTGGDQFYALSNTSLADDKWHHVVGVIDKSNNSNCYIYIDGIEDTDSRSGTITDVGSITNSSSLRIGNGEVGGVFFSGKIGNVKIWNQALTAEQISQLYTESKFKYGK